MTVADDLATLRRGRKYRTVPDGHTGQFVVVDNSDEFDAALARVEAEIARLREQRFGWLSDDDMCRHGYVREDAAHPAAGLEKCPVCDLSHLREERDATMRSYESCLSTLRKAVETAEAAEQRLARLRDGLRALEELAQAWLKVDTYDGADMEPRRTAHARAQMVLDQARALLAEDGAAGGAA